MLRYAKKHQRIVDKMNNITSLLQYKVSLFLRFKVFDDIYFLRR